MWMKFIAFLFVFTVMPIIQHLAAQEALQKYRKVDTHEARPGLLAITEQSQNGNLCRIVLQKQAFSHGVMRLNNDISEKQLNEVIDELAPLGARGRQTDLGKRSLSLISGDSSTRVDDYQNVVIKTFSQERGSHEQAVAATIEWKANPCPD